MNSDIDEWNVTFADTDVDANIGQRLQIAKKYLDDDEVFLANYSDGLTDLPFDAKIEQFYREKKVASFACVRPNLSCYFVSLSANGVVQAIEDMNQADLRINGGCFILRRDIFTYLRGGEDLQ